MLSGESIEELTNKLDLYDQPADSVVFQIIRNLKRKSEDNTANEFYLKSLIPLYIKTAYKNEPVFQNSKVVYSMYNGAFEGNLSKEKFLEKAPISAMVEPEHLNAYK